MNSQRFLIISLLCALVGCAGFKWNKVGDVGTDYKLESVGHQGASDGTMFVAWQDKHNKQNLNAFNYYSVAGNSAFSKVAHIFDPDPTMGYENLVLQTSSTGKNAFIAYFGCKNSFTDFAKRRDSRPCAHVYFTTSVNGGKAWSKPIKITDKDEYIAPSSTLSMFLERDTGKIFIFYALQSKDDEISSEIVGYAKDPTENEFKHIVTLPKVTRLTSFLTAVTIGEKHRYLHLLFTDSKSLFYTRSEDRGKTWTNYTSLANDVAPNHYNYVANDPLAKETGLYIQYREKNGLRLVVLSSNDHGKTFEEPKTVDSNSKSPRDAIGMCGSEETGEYIVISGHADFDPDRGFIRVLRNGKGSFVDLPYPFKKIKGSPTANLLVDCAYKGGKEFYITFGILAGGGKNTVYFAHGILEI